MASKELIASVIEAIVKNPPKVTRFKDMETLELSEVVDYAPTAQAAISTVRAALEPTDEMLAVPYKYRDLRSIIRDVIAASALGEQSDG